MTEMPPRFLNDQEAYEIAVPSECSFEAGESVDSALERLTQMYARGAEICRRVVDTLRGVPGIEVQIDDTACIVKGPRSLLDPLLAEGVLCPELSDDQESPPEFPFEEDVLAVLSDAPLRFEGVVQAVREFSGWRDINPEWVRATLERLVEHQVVALEEGEYVVPLSEEEALLAQEPQRNERHQWLWENADSFGESASKVIRGLLDELYGVERLQN